MCSGCGDVKGSASLSFLMCAGWLETQKFSDWSMSKKLKKPISAASYALSQMLFLKKYLA